MAQNQNYAEKAREAIVSGQRITEEKKLAQYEPETLLSSLVDQSDGIVPQILQRLQVEPERVSREVASLVDRAPKLQISSEAIVSQGLRKALTDAETEAAGFGDEYISTEHLLLGILRQERSPAESLLRGHGVDREAVMTALTEIRGSQRDHATTR